LVENILNSADFDRVCALEELCEREMMADYNLLIAARRRLVELAVSRGDTGVLKLRANVGSALLDFYQYADATQVFLEVLAEETAALGSDHNDVVLTMNNLANCYQGTAEFEKSVDMHRKILAVREAKLGGSHAETLDSIHNVAGALFNKNEADEAMDMYTRAYEGRLRLNSGARDRHQTDVADSCMGIATVYEARGEHVEAMKHYEIALENYERSVGCDHPSVCNVLNNMALVSDTIGDCDRALELINRVLALQQDQLGADNLDTLNTMDSLGTILFHSGDKAGAIENFGAALRGHIEQLGEQHPYTQDIARNLREVLDDIIAKEA
jgi:tetratricopeptide (TPR) repeat protein